MMCFKIITLFPEFFTTPLQSSLLGKASEKGIADFKVIDLRMYSKDKFSRCDDYPYGGGSGMVLKPEPLAACLDEIVSPDDTVVYLSPSGKTLNQEMVKSMNLEKSMVLICGHYEGIDQRIIDQYVDMEISVGDYILSGGEPAALVLIDSLSRYIPGFMSNSESLEEESFENSLLEYPHYTRPAVFNDVKVPDVLLSGNHAEIDKWRFEMSVKKTKMNRPDLYQNYLNDKGADK